MQCSALRHQPFAIPAYAGHRHDQDRVTYRSIIVCATSPDASDESHTAATAARAVSTVSEEADNQSRPCLPHMYDQSRISKRVRNRFVARCSRRAKGRRCCCVLALLLLKRAGQWRVAPRRHGRVRSAASQGASRSRWLTTSPRTYSVAIRQASRTTDHASSTSARNPVSLSCSFDERDDRFACCPHRSVIDRHDARDADDALREEHSRVRRELARIGGDDRVREVGGRGFQAGDESRSRTIRPADSSSMIDCSSSSGSGTSETRSSTSTRSAGSP